MRLYVHSLCRTLATYIFWIYFREIYIRNWIGSINICMYLKVCENGWKVHARLYECVVLVYLWGFDYEYMCVLVDGSCDGTFAPVYAHIISSQLHYLCVLYMPLVPYSILSLWCHVVRAYRQGMRRQVFVWYIVSRYTLAPKLYSEPPPSQPSFAYE